MSVFTERRDYLLDMIQQLAERIVAMLQRAKGGQVELAQLERDCERAMDDEFAELDRRMKDVAPRMVGHLVRPVERLRSYGLLVAARALLAHRRAEESPEGGGGDEVELEAQARRALCLVLEVTVQSEVTPVELDAVRQLYPRVDDGRLTPRYLEALVALAPG